MGLAVATTRRNGHGLPKDSWVPAQKIAIGRAADSVMLSRKVDLSEPLSFYWGSVDLTIIDGRIVHGY